MTACSCNEILANYNRDNVEWQCVVGGDPEGCMQMVVEGEAEMTKFGGGLCCCKWKGGQLLSGARACVCVCVCVCGSDDD